MYSVTVRSPPCVSIDLDKLREFGLGLLYTIAIPRKKSAVEGVSFGVISNFGQIIARKALGLDRKLIYLI
jgi:hypothetical protein